MGDHSKVYWLKEEHVIARDTQLWMGIDSHAKTIHVTVLDEEGIVHRASYAAEKGHIDRLVARLPGCEVTAVYEAGPTGFKLLRWLREAGCDAFVTAPSLVPVAGGKRVKTDRRDSLDLAKAARGGMLESVWDLSDEEYADRELVRTRRQLVDHRADIQRQIRSKLLFHGIQPPPEVKPTWSRPFLQWLANPSTGHPTVDSSLKALVHVWHALSKEIADLTKEIRQLAKAERYAQRAELLCSVPGIGVLTAMIILTELQDFNRFPSASELAAYLGLIPSEYSSGETTRKGPITKTGNTRVRSALVEASWVLIRHDPELRTFHRRVAGHTKEGRKKAIVAVARKLSARLLAMIRKGERYRLPEETTADGRKVA